MSTSTVNSFYVRGLRSERRATRNRNLLAWVVMGLGFGIAAVGILVR